MTGINSTTKMQKFSGGGDVVKLDPGFGFDQIFDVMHFFNRDNQYLGGVCSDMNKASVLHPNTKPRHHFPKLSIRPGMNFDSSSQKVWIARDHHSCMQDLESMVNSMVGSLLIPTAHAENIFEMSVWWKQGQQPMEMEFANRFTATTAFDFLHMLKYLDSDAHIDEVVFCRGIRLPFFGGMRFKISCTDLFVPVFDQPSLNNILEYFRIHDVGLVAQKVRIHLIGGGGEWKTWPSNPFNPTEASSGGPGKFVFDYVNTYSGKDYQVTVTVCNGNVINVTLK